MTNKIRRRDVFKALGGAVIAVTVGGTGASSGAGTLPPLGEVVKAGPFEVFVAEIQHLAWRDGACPSGELYCEIEAWRPSFEDGLTAAEAWQEECWAAAEMLG